MGKSFSPPQRPSFPVGPVDQYDRKRLEGMGIHLGDEFQGRAVGQPQSTGHLSLRPNGLHGKIRYIGIDGRSPY